ncbi:MAG: alpha-2-macroglobulin family protein [Candidatus Eremiobacteraeota bacterium]|nr:alpha-2-macroglobulin family protein [Candidatus Eremiobacteraeota bacterium]
MMKTRGTIPRALVVTLLVTAVAACTTSQGGRALVPVPAISALPAPVLPAWITQVSPVGGSDENAQIRVRFTRDVVKVEALSSADRGSILNAFELEPAVPGRFVVYTPRLVAYEADAPLPSATRFRVTLRRGLADLAGDRLDRDLAWTFRTTDLQLSGLPAQETDAQPPVVGLRPQFGISSTAAVDQTSLAARTQLVPENASSASPIGVAVAEATASPTPLPQDASDAQGERETPNFTYVLTPRAALEAGRAYRVVVASGVAPAAGNLSSTQSFTGHLRTRGALEFTHLEPYERPADSNGIGRFSGGAPQLDFTNPLNADSARAAVHVLPAPHPLLVEANDGDPWIRIGSAGLAPRTRYTIGVDSSLRDAFGQTLSKTITATFETSDLAADLWAPAGTNIFPADRNLQLNVYATNLPERRFETAFRLVQPVDLVDATDAQPTGEGQPSLAPPASSWRSTALSERNNVETVTAIPLRAELRGTTGMLAYGVRGRTNRYPTDSHKLAWAQPEFYGTVQLTNLGVFAQWFPHAGVVQVNRLSDGSPVPNARITVYESRTDLQAFAGKPRPPPEPCASGTADRNGTWRLDGATFAACAATSTSATEAPNLLVIARDGADWASVRTDSWSGSYEDGLNGGWSAGEPEPRGVIASDRSLYQPGETAYFSGLAYFVTNGALGRGRAGTYALTLESPSGAKRSLGNAVPDEFGVFSLALPLARDQELGYYTLHARASNGEALDGSFRVAEFKPPNFRVSLSLDRSSAAAGSTVRASAKSEYLFGAPVGGGRVQETVTRQRTYFTPPGFESWDFGRVWLYPEEEPTVSGDVLQRDVAIGQNGAVAFDVPVKADLAFPMSYRVDVQTTDVANVAVSDSKTFTALPSSSLIGLNGDFVANAGAPVSIKVLVVSPQAKPIAGRSLRVVLQRRTFAQATRLIEGGLAPQESAQYTTVDQRDLTSAAEAQTALLTPREPGEYRIRANFSDAKDDATATDHSLWVSGNGAAEWSSEGNRLPVKLDKTSYRPGELATAVIASPYDEAELDFAVIRSGVLYHERRIVKGSAPRVQFRVAETMLPNASVEALLIRRGPPLSRGVPKGLDQLARIGFAAFATKLDGKVVKIALKPTQKSAAPGSPQRVEVRLTDDLGKPISGEVALMVVNDAVLQLTGYRPPDLINTVYAEQSISTRFADSRTNVVLNALTRPREKGYGYGGGLMAGAGDTRVRTQFKPIAYFNGKLRTGSDGVAEARFVLPDDLTTWRIMALAFTRDARFGNGENTFVTTKPLIANPVAPQFARPGDTLDGGVSVTNTAKAAGTLRIAGSVSGGLTFSNNGTLSPSASLDTDAPQGVAAYRFGMRVTSPAQGRMEFRTALAGNTDAFAVPFLVRTSDVLESVVDTGVTRDRVAIPLSVSTSVPNDAGGLDAELASTIVPNVAEAVRQALDDDSGFGWSVVSRLDVAADGLLLARTYRQPQSSEQRQAVTSAIALLTTLANDGGIAEWPGATSSEPFLDAAAYAALAHARSAGFESAGVVLSRLRTALLRTMRNPAAHGGFKKEPERSEVRLATLAALAENGEVRSDFLSEIVAQSDHLTTSERFTLARLLRRLPGWHADAAHLAASLQGQLAQTARTTTVTANYAGVEEQSAAVRFLVATRAPLDLIDGSVNALVGLQQDGTWGCGCANASALDAVVAYASLQPAPPDFHGTLSVGTAYRRSFSFAGYRSTQLSVALPMRDVPRGQSDVVLEKRGSGTLRYAVSYRYRVAEDAPGRYQGLRLDRIVRAAGSDPILATFGLGPASTLDVKPASVFEVEDRIITDHAVDRVTIVDPLAAGLEAVDTSFLTSSQAVHARTDNWEIDYQQIYHDRVEAFARHLNPGVYAMHYLVRSVTPGNYAWPAANVYLERAPEEFGRTSAGKLIVR